LSHSRIFTAMFAQHAGRTARRLGQTTWRAVQRRGYAAETTSTKPPGGAGGRAAKFLLTGFAFSTLGAVATWQAMSSRGMGFYSDEDSLKKYTPEEADLEAKNAEQVINTHPLVTSLRARSDLTESRPHMKMPGQYRAKSLTGGALLGPGRVSVPPYAWNDEHGKEMVALFHVGEDVCGHPGIVHGGLLATILDEGLGRCCFKSLPHNIAVTANLNVNYRKPTPASTFLVLKAETYKVEGRKAWVRGRLEQLAAPGEEPIVFAEAEALFISPKYAAMMPRIT